MAQVTFEISNNNKKKQKHNDNNNNYYYKWIKKIPIYGGTPSPRTSPILFGAILISESNVHVYFQKDYWCVWLIFQSVCVSSASIPRKKRTLCWFNM